MLSEIYGQHSIYEDLLVALAALCNRVRTQSLCSKGYPTDELKFLQERTVFSRRLYST